LHYQFRNVGIAVVGIAAASPSGMLHADWIHCRNVTRHVWLVMHVSRFFRIFMRAKKQTCKQMQCNGATLIQESQPASGIRRRGWGHGWNPTPIKH